MLIHHNKLTSTLTHVKHGILTNKNQLKKVKSRRIILNTYQQKKKKDYDSTIVPQDCCVEMK